MKLVVEIDEEVIMAVNHHYTPVENDIKIYDAIRNGTPLPKGHGRLIDADELKKDDEVTKWVSRDALRTGKNLKMFSELFLKKIDDAPTVIEGEEE